jgi:hypothetical protein
MKGIKSVVYGLSSIVFFLAGCGYSTRGFLNSEYRTVHVKPVINAVMFTNETQQLGEFRTIPPLIENAFTQALVDRFALDGGLRTVGLTAADLIVTTTITDYRREALRYTSEEAIEEYRIWMQFRVIVTTDEGSVFQDAVLTADETYALTGSRARSENAAIDELMDDAARRLVESIVEAW